MVDSGGKPGDHPILPTLVPDRATKKFPSVSSVSCRPGHEPAVLSPGLTGGH